MKYDPEKHHRGSIRLRGYDYSQQGAYFVTICAQNGECLFGEVVDGKMQLNECGNIVQEFWNRITMRFSNVRVDVHIVMPNHIHGIIVIADKCRGGVSPPQKKRTLGQIVAYFKYQSTKEILNTPQCGCSTGTTIWQRNYYEHIIRNQEDLNQIRQYIMKNPLKWELDSENPQNVNI